ncbi:M24 family metallopeptidase [Anaeromicrobium sediminis]|uniref:Xaa-Pro dipeptidase n=1 Tax=Anaeromicrobium sediminis TaxID=1478221 RepID=A0A267MQA4_9FIRM|nr:Xaa-Pro peptidase family protein [Anaeromicrobium sediminis]PAB60953.1 Xaa-Pro dipeptidase [Anaeromicrobium sediminis]
MEVIPIEQRINNLKNLFNESNLEAALIYKPENRRYFSGFTGTSGYVLITKDKNYFLTDFRYVEQAKNQCRAYDILKFDNNSKGNSLYDIIEKLNVRKIGFESEFITLKEYETLKNKISNTDFIPIDDEIKDLRKIKDSIEVEYIRKAASIADEAFAHICSFIKPGITERDIAIELEFFMKKRGATELSFDSIVASGKRSALPHGVYTDKIIENGDFITLDFGCVYEGYCSDMTRTIVVGKANEKQKEIYNIVLEAQKRALENIRPNVECSKIDKIARDYISEKGYGEYFGHGLGHGVGMEVHESPRLSPVSSDILKPNMVVTDEPGIYVPQFGGVRIEDLVVVTNEGHEVLSKSPKELIEL